MPQVIDQTIRWINEVVIGCNFCPFAAKVMRRQKVHYHVEPGNSLKICLGSFLNELTHLDEDNSIETTFLIFPDSYKKFKDFLGLVAAAEKFVGRYKYEGIYQVASFHPLYIFANSKVGDAANYTNRSPYPMLQLLREESIDKALDHYQNPEAIPDQNVRFAREKGEKYMKGLRDACLKP